VSESEPGTTATPTSFEQAAAEVKLKNEEPWLLPRCLDYAVSCKTSADYAKALVLVASHQRARGLAVEGRFRHGVVADAGLSFLALAMNGSSSQPEIERQLLVLLAAQRVTWGSFAAETGKDDRGVLSVYLDRRPRPELPIGDSRARALEVSGLSGLERDAREEVLAENHAVASPIISIGRTQRSTIGRLNAGSRMPT
jgi:hypothetical protein